MCYTMDYIISLPPSQGYSAILVIVDRFSKMAHFIPTTNEVDAPTTASLFLNNIYKLHGLPDDMYLIMALPLLLNSGPPY